MSRNKSVATKPLALSVAISMILAGQAVAQQEESSDESEGYGFEQIIITAQKRSESLQETPLAVSAFTGDELREDGVSTVEDIGSRTPGLVFAAFSVGQPEIAIRGIGTKEDGAAASDSTVISVDDVYIAARTAQVFDIFDLERVEVLRGPQGTLYGKNSIGGSINFITSKPTEELTGRTRVTVGDNGRFDIGGMLSGGLSESLLGKFSFSRRSYDGHITNVHTGEKHDTQETLAWRGQLKWFATDDLSVTFTFDGADDDMGDTHRVPVGSAGDSTANNANNPLAVAAAFGADGDPFRAANDEIGSTDRDVAGYAVKVNYETEDYTFVSVTSYRESDFLWWEDSEGLPGFTTTDPTVAPENGFRRDVTDTAIEDSEQLTQELRLLSPGGEKFDWVVGLFYSEETINRTETFCIPNCGFNVIPASQIAYPAGTNRLPDALILNRSIQSNDSVSWAAYGQGTYQISDAWKITGGLRYSYEEKDVAFKGDIDDGIAPVGVFIQENFSVVANDDWGNVSGRVVVDFQASDDVMLYGSISNGFKSGGFIGSPSTPGRAVQSFDEETAINYEFGFKSFMFDSTFKLNGALFFTDYEDLQVTRFTQLADNPTNPFGEFITENAASAEIQGIELEFAWMASEDLEFGGSYAYLDATYQDFTPNVANLAPNGGTGACAAGSNAVSANPVDGCIPDFSGKTLRQAPENMLHIYARYYHDLGDSGMLKAKVSYRFQDDSFYDPDNNEITMIPDYALWDAQLTWTDVDDNWMVTAWVKNLTDEEYRTHIYSQRSAQIAFANFGAPRTVGVTVEYSF